MCGALTHIAVTHSNILTSVRSTVGHPPASAHTERSLTTPCTARKHQLPNSNFQTNLKSQFPNSQTSLKVRRRCFAIKVFLLVRRSGASDGSRTRNLFLDQEALYQLSYRGAVLLSTKSASLWSLMIGHCLVFGAWFLGFPCCARYP